MKKLLVIAILMAGCNGNFDHNIDDVDEQAYDAACEKQWDAIYDAGVADATEDFDIEMVNMDAEIERLNIRNIELESIIRGWMSQNEKLQERIDEKDLEYSALWSAYQDCEVE